MMGLTMMIMCLAAFVAGLENGKPGSTAELATATAYVYRSAENQLPRRLDVATQDAIAASEELSQ